jgi:hypothetical protein
MYLNVKQESVLWFSIIISIVLYGIVFALNASRFLVGNGLMPTRLFGYLFYFDYIIPFAIAISIYLIVYQNSHRGALRRRTNFIHEISYKLRAYLWPVLLVLIVFIIFSITIFFKPSLMPMASALSFCFFLAITPFWKSRKKILGIVLVIALVGGSYLVGLVSFSTTVNSFNTQDPAKRVYLTSEYIATHFYYDNTFRFSNDPWGFIIGGIGYCEEMAYAENLMLSYEGINSHVVSLVGEDHAFVEAYVYGQWMASDPGYGYFLNTTIERGNARIAEFGGLSLIYVDGTNPPEFVTERYVPTDTVIIQVLKNSSPCSNAIITLKHEYRGQEQDSPNIPVDSNGTIVMQIGCMQYNSEAYSTQDFYTIWVNGKDTEQTITSYGNGTISKTIVNLPLTF